MKLSDLKTMVEGSAKRRHEIHGDKIRALYGHSLPQEISMSSDPPPTVLYHGTSPLSLEAILAEGLLPMGRQRVHMSKDIKTATLVGKRKAQHPVILRIAAEAASQEGIQFHRGNELVWLSERVPPQFISIEIPEGGVDP